MDNQNPLQQPSPKPNTQPAPFSNPAVSNNQMSASPKMKLKLIVGAIVSLSLLGGAYYLGSQTSKQTPKLPIPTAKAQPTIDPMVNWKSYSSNAGKYSIKYPTTLTLQENQISSVDGVKIPSKDTIELLPIGLTIIFKNIEKDQTLNDYLTKNSWCVDITPEKGKPFTLDGEQGLIFENTPCGSWGITEIDVLHDGILYTIGIVNDAEVAFKILSTFKFMNNLSPSIQVPPPVNLTPAMNNSTKLLPTNGWVEISNAVFSFQYPADKFTPTSSPKYIQLVPKDNTANYGTPSFLIADDYYGGSIRQWYLKHYGYNPEDDGKEVFFIEKTLGTHSVLEVKLVNENLPRDVILTNENTLLDISKQGADLILVETMISTLSFK